MNPIQLASTLLYFLVTLGTAQPAPQPANVSHAPKLEVPSVVTSPLPVSVAPREIVEP